MNRAQLQEALHKLHEELDRSEGVDEESRRLLIEIRNDIEAILAGRPPAPGEPAESEPSIDERLKASVINFEGTHPALTAAINRVVDALAEMGL